MGPEQEKGESPKYEIVTIEKGLPVEGEPRETMDISVEISPDGNTYTANVTLEGRSAVGTARKTPGQSASHYAVQNALEILDEQATHDWFLKTDGIGIIQQ